MIIQLCSDEVLESAALVNDGYGWGGGHGWGRGYGWGGGNGYGYGEDKGDGWG